MSELKDKAKELCEESACHHKCHDTKDCVVEDEALLLTNQDKSNNFDVKGNTSTQNQLTNFELEQIEEMEMTPLDVLANDIYQHCPDLKDNYCGDTHCVACLANALYNAGYRKQSEGEWIVKALNNPMYESKKAPHCSNCGYMSFIRYDYCPNCGAKMKGGEE